MKKGKKGKKKVSKKKMQEKKKMAKEMEKVQNTNESANENISESTSEEISSFVNKLVDEEAKALADSTKAIIEEIREKIRKNKEEYTNVDWDSAVGEILNEIFEAYIPETKEIEIDMDDYMTAECFYKVPIFSLYNPNFMPSEIARFAFILDTLRKVLEKETGYRIYFSIAWIDDKEIALKAKNETLYQELSKYREKSFRLRIP